MKRAAELLDTSATTVSRHIRSLTEEFGTMLAYHNKGEDWVLTQEGLHLVEVAADLNRRMFELNEGPDAKNRPSITITSLEFVLTYLLAPRLPDLRKANPNLDVSLFSSDKRVSLAFGEADIALRFGRPTEGQLVAKRLTDISFYAWHPVGAKNDRWVGMTEEFDWTPDMQMGRKIFGRPPSVRASSYAASKEAAAALGYGTVGPSAVMQDCPELQKDERGLKATRELWVVFHESRRFDHALISVKTWIDDMFAPQPEPNSASAIGLVK